MTDDADLDRARGGELLRLVTLVIGSAEVICFVLFAHLMLQSAGPPEAAFDEGATVRFMAPLLLLTLPGLLLAWLDRSPRMALVLVLAALPAAAAIWLI